MFRLASALMLAAIVLVSIPAPARADFEVTNVRTYANPIVILLRTLSQGSSGEDVARLQAFLQTRGYFTYPVATGYFGFATQAAVVAFQKDNGIDPAGIAGPLTRARIAVLSAPPVVITGIAVATSAPPRHHHHSSHSDPTPSVDTQPPTISLTAPPASALLSGAGVTLSADASDDTGVAGVQFQVDGSSVGAEVTAAPYSMTWDSTSVADGAHAITAVARDAQGNMATSTGASVTIDNTAPVVTIIGPIGTVLSSSPIALGANVDDDSAVTVTLVVTDAAPPNTARFSSGDLTSTPFGVSWTPPGNGSYVLTATATDAAGNVGTATKAFSYTVLDPS